MVDTRDIHQAPLLERLAAPEAENQELKDAYNARLSQGSRSEVAYMNEVDELRGDVERLNTLIKERDNEHEDIVIRRDEWHQKANYYMGEVERLKAEVKWRSDRMLNAAASIGPMLEDTHEIRLRAVHNMLKAGPAPLGLLAAAGEDYTKYPSVGCLIAGMLEDDEAEEDEALRNVFDCEADFQETQCCLSAGHTVAHRNADMTVVWVVTPGGPVALVARGAEDV